jgi:hypothetical protein
MVESAATASRPDRTGTTPSFSLMVWTGIALVCLTLAATLAWSSWQSRERFLAGASHRMDNLAAILKGNTARTFGEIDLLLRLAAEEHAAAGGASHLPLVKSAMGDGTRLVGIRLIDPRSGQLLDGSGLASAAFNRLDEAALKHHVGAAANALRIGDPVLDQEHGNWVIGVSRRVRDAWRGLDVIVLGVVDARVIRDVYDRVDVGAGGAVTLFTNGGTVLARRPDADTLIGQRFDRLPLFQPPHAAQEAGLYTTNNATVDGVPRIVAFRRLGEFPSCCRPRSRSTRCWRPGGARRSATSRSYPSRWRCSSPSGRSSTGRRAGVGRRRRERRRRPTCSKRPWRTWTRAS